MVKTSVEDLYERHLKLEQPCDRGVDKYNSLEICSIESILNTTAVVNDSDLMNSK